VQCQVSVSVTLLCMVSMLSGTPGLLFGAAGIYASWLFYGTLQEDVFCYEDASGRKFRQVWLLMVLEALMNIFIGFIGMMITGRTDVLPLKYFACIGSAEVLSKAFGNEALAAGLSFPVATLCKSAKMAPVMVGAIFIGGQKYQKRRYLQVFLIITASVLVSMNSKRSGGNTNCSALGVVFICSSLVFDGLTGGVQDRLRKVSEERGVKVKPYEFMFWSNFSMLLVSLLFAVVLGQIFRGMAFLVSNPQLLTKVLVLTTCSATGQSFIFFLIAEYGSLKNTTVTTTRKIFSVLLSIFTKGHTLNAIGWFGVLLGSLGMAGELVLEKKPDVASNDRSRAVLADATLPLADERSSSSVEMNRAQLHC